MIRIGSLDVDLERRQLLRDGVPLRVGGRAFDLLAVLVEARGALVSKNELLRQVWPNTVVEENNLHVHLCRLRSLLGESRDLLQMVSGRGYRLAGTKQEEDGNAALRDLPYLSETGADRFVPNNLPPGGAAIIGRDDAILDVIGSLKSGTHVTLVGAGGIGKTRLAVEVTRRLLTSFPDGVYLISLASATDAEGVLGAASSALGINSVEGLSSLARVITDMSGPRLLFVLDNCEQVIEAAPRLSESLAALKGQFKKAAQFGGRRSSRRVSRLV